MSKNDKPCPNRVLIEVIGGVAYAMTTGNVEWELVDHDSVEAGERWEDDAIARLERWGLRPGTNAAFKRCIERCVRDLREANKTPAD